jgi:hypothetical protein
MLDLNGVSHVHAKGTGALEGGLDDACFTTLALSRRPA